jgi:hypothetical protein
VNRKSQRLPSIVMWWSSATASPFARQCGGRVNSAARRFILEPLVGKGARRD